jgi:hypothetical protein
MTNLRFNCFVLQSNLSQQEQNVNNKIIRNFQALDINKLVLFRRPAKRGDKSLYSKIKMWYGGQADKLNVLYILASIPTNGWCAAWQTKGLRGESGIYLPQDQYDRAYYHIPYAK